MLKGTKVLSSYGNAGWGDKPDVFAKFRQDVSMRIDPVLHTTKQIKNVEPNGGIGTLISDTDNWDSTFTVKFDKGSDKFYAELWDYDPIKNDHIGSTSHFTADAMLRACSTPPTGWNGVEEWWMVH